MLQKDMGENTEQSQKDAIGAHILIQIDFCRTFPASKIIIIVTLVAGLPER